MNEQAQQLLNEAGEKVLTYLEATEGFAVEQAPLLAQEIVRWGVWWNGGWLLVAYPTAVMLVISAWRFGHMKDAWGDSVVYGILSLSCGVGAFFALLISTAEALPNFIKALIVPHLYIIEQIGGLFG